MKKMRITFFIAFFYLNGYAQYFPIEQTVYGKNYKGLRPSSEFKIAEDIDSVFNGKGKFKDRTLTRYNTFGKIQFKESGQGKLKTYYEIYRDSIYKAAYTLHKGDTGGFWCYAFVENGSPVCYQYGYKKSRNIRVTDSTYYDEKGRRIKWMRFNRKLKLVTYTQYAYNSTGAMAEAKTFDKHQKLKYVYSYTCDAKGEVLKGVKQGNFCKKDGVHADGRFYEIIENTNEKGKLRRYIYTYSADSLLLTYEYSSVDGTPKGKNEYTYSKEGKLIGFTNYTAKGKLQFRYEYELNERGFRIYWRQFNKHGKLLSTEKSYYTWFS